VVAAVVQGPCDLLYASVLIRLPDEPSAMRIEAELFETLEERGQIR
jgi:hypothetical protein